MPDCFIFGYIKLDYFLHRIQNTEVFYIFAVKLND